MIEAAPAKLNLALHVTGRREDGYHLLDSLVAFATVGDVITLTPGRLSLTIDGPFSQGLDAGDDNLCLRAARLIGGQAAIHLTKNLPVASGIGGGSADAAAVLRAFAATGLTMPEDTQHLGADVPACLAGTAARMRGIGERLDPVPLLPPLPIVLVNPGVPLATPQVFAALDRADNPPMPNSEWQDAASLIYWLAQCRNDLETPALTLAPVIGDVLARLRGHGARIARMSGSGATCFGIFDDADHAKAGAIAMSHPGWWSIATELASPLRRG